MWEENLHFIQGNGLNSGTRARSILTKYRVVYNHLCDFLSIMRNRKNIAYKELTEQFIWEFDSYQHDIVGLSHNTVWMYTIPYCTVCATSAVSPAPKFFDGFTTTNS